MISSVTRMLDGLARLALVLVFATVSSCGGGVSAPAAIGSGPLAMSPATATVYSGLPTTFVITGGTGSYFVTSNDQSIIPNTGLFSGPSFTVVPGPVLTDTPLSLTVTDTAANTPAISTLTVKPRTVGNTITITPSASQSAACGSAICAGGDAEVKATLSIGGVPLINREVRFQVVSGDFRIITSAPGAPEVLSLEGTTFTDDTGTARMRIRALSDSGSQTALIQITDLSSGFSQRAAFNIAPSSNAPLNAQPATIEFMGRDPNTCASGIEADVIVFGGRPPYQISQPGSFAVSPSVVATSGGRFTVRAIGQCSSGSQIAVVDANGATVTVTAVNRLSEVPAPTPTPTPAMTVAPSTLTVLCGQSGSVTVIGGSGSYFWSSSHPRISAVVSGNTVTITRATGDVAPPYPLTGDVAINDGTTVRTVAVTTSANCP